MIVSFPSSIYSEVLKVIDNQKLIADTVTFHFLQIKVIRGDWQIAQLY